MPIQKSWLLAMFLVAAPLSDTDAQAAALAGLLGNATEFNFYLTRAGAPASEAQAEDRYGARGVGFELSFGIPGGLTRKRVRPDTTAKDESCEARFIRGDFKTPVPCSDTSYKAVKRTTNSGAVSYEEEIEIKKFSWTEPKLALDLGIGFSQVGAYVSRTPGQDYRVSLREAPSVAIYVSYQPEPQFLKSWPIRPRPYAGVRTGLITLNAGRAYVEDKAITFGGETFELGVVGGLITKVSGIWFFSEAAYMRRDFKSLEWETGKTIKNLPHRLNMSGASIAAGIQISLKPNK